MEKPTKVQPTNVDVELRNYTLGSVFVAEDGSVLRKLDSVGNNNSASVGLDYSQRVAFFTGLVRMGRMEREDVPEDVYSDVRRSINDLTGLTRARRRDKSTV
jgi:hypothetical protein